MLQSHSLPVVGGTFVAALSPAMALAFFFAAFLFRLADFSFLRRMALFVVALCFLGIWTFLSRVNVLTLTAALSEVNEPLAGGAGARRL